MNPDGTENKALYGSGSYFPNSTFDMKPLSKHSSRFIGIIFPAITGRHVQGGSSSSTLPKAGKEEKGMIQELPFKDRLDRPDHQGRIGGRRLASVHEAVPAQRKIF